MMNRNALSILLILCTVFGGCKESSCERDLRVGGPEYLTTFVYKYIDGQDYTDNIILVKERGRDSVFFINGYKPIPLHNGFYLGGNIPKIQIPSQDVYLLSVTYTDLENGLLPEGWLEDWENYLLFPLEYEQQVPCPFYRLFGRVDCECTGDRCYYKNSPLYNDKMLLDVPLIEDRHIDTNVLNRWIDNAVDDDLSPKLMQYYFTPKGTI